ncbi:sensor histidine kinase [Actinomadura sp. SCN-SB]|uniref:sensor histidine kinase n=1 Tax=Actinomadura sp. SCN-SB TaxID=3373092 RepID=UPI003753A10E
MAMKAGAVTALVAMGMFAVLLFSIRHQVAEYHQIQTTGAGFRYIHLIKRNRLPPRLPDGGNLAAQVLDERGAVIAATPNMAGLPRMATFRPSEETMSIAREVEDLPGPKGRMRVRVFRVYQPGGDWLVYVANRSVPWFVSDEVSTFLLATAVLIGLLAGARTWRTVDRTLAPVDAIRAELAEITATESGRRVPVPECRDEIRLLAETANATLDRLDAALERQRRFTSEASHDLRNPITAARTRLEEALLFPEESDWPQVGRSVLENLERLQAIVTDLLELARLDAESPDKAGEVIDLAELVGSDLEDRQGGMKRIVPRLEGDVRVRGDRLRLSRLLSNLLDNAERHAEEEITVTVRAEGDTAVMEVLDDGQGIPPEHRELVFQRFSRLKASRERDPEGTGLGLPMAREIANVHNGTLTIEDSPRGARFVLRIPRVT